MTLTTELFSLIDLIIRSGSKSSEPKPLGYIKTVRTILAILAPRKLAVTFQKATIYLGNIPLEVFMLPDGHYVLSQTQMAQSVEKDELSVRQFGKSKSP